MSRMGSPVVSSGKSNPKKTDTIKKTDPSKRQKPEVPVAVPNLPGLNVKTRSITKKDTPPPSTPRSGEKRQLDDKDANISSPPKRHQGSAHSSPSKAMKNLQLMTPETTDTLKTTTLPDRYLTVFPMLHFGFVREGNIILTKTVDVYDPSKAPPDHLMEYEQAYVHQLNDKDKTAIHMKIRKFVIIAVAANDHFTALPIHTKSIRFLPGDCRAELLDERLLGTIRNPHHPLSQRLKDGPICRGRLTNAKNVIKGIPAGPGTWLISRPNLAFPGHMSDTSTIELTRPTVFSYATNGLFVGKILNEQQLSTLKRWFFEAMAKDMNMKDLSTYMNTPLPNKATWDTYVQMSIDPDSGYCHVCHTAKSTQGSEDK